MKVALCTETIYPLYGVERRVYEMASRLPEYGWETEVITSSPASCFPGLNIVQVSKPTITNPPKRSGVNCMSFMIGAYRALKSPKYGIIDANGHLALLPSYYAAAGRPVIGTIHDVYGDKWKEIYGGGSVLRKKLGRPLPQS